MSEDVKRSDTPFDRLTFLAEEMTVPLERPENDDVRAIVFLQDGHRGGIQVHGYEDSTDALADLFVHMKAMFEAHGKTLDLIAVPDTVKGAER